MNNSKIVDNVNYYGVKETFCINTETDRHVEEVRLNGYTILKNILTKDILNLIREGMDQILEQQILELGGEAVVNKINDTSIVRSPLVYDELFLRIATQSEILAILEKLLGDYYTLVMQNGNINFPDKLNYQTNWHRDLNYQHFVSSRPLAISALYAIDDFNEDTGGTVVLPGSHKNELFPSKEFIYNNEKGIIADAGDVIVFDAMMYHRSGNNRSGKKRRALNNIYGIPIIKQQISLPKVFGTKYKSDPFLSKFLGYDTEPANTPYEWRLQKINKLS